MFTCNFGFESIFFLPKRQQKNLKIRFPTSHLWKIQEKQKRKPRISDHCTQAKYFRKRLWPGTSKGYAINIGFLINQDVDSKIKPFTTSPCSPSGHKPLPVLAVSPLAAQDKIQSTSYFALARFCVRMQALLKPLHLDGKLLSALVQMTDCPRDGYLEALKFG